MATIRKRTHKWQVLIRRQGLSVRFRFDRTLGQDFTKLKIWLGLLIIAAAQNEKSRIRPNTKPQIFDAVDSVLANFLEAHRRSTKCFVAISLSEQAYTKSMYFKREFGYTNFKRVLDFLKTCDPPLVTYKDGFNDPKTKTGRVSRFIPTKHFLDILNGYVQLWVFAKPGTRGRLNNASFVQLALAYSKGRQFTRIDVPISATHHREASDCIRLKDSEKRLKIFSDTAEIKRMRKDLEKWNAFLETDHHIDLLLSDDEIENLYQREDEDEKLAVFENDERDRPKFVELERVRLYRVFNNGSFDEGGRFYGGWWQNVPSNYRQFITINGRSTWEYDYSSLHPAMLYALEGLPLANDAYEIEGIEPTKSNRKLIKTTFLKLINAQKGQRIDRPRIGAIPRGWTWESLQKSIIEKHAPIKHQFRTGIGLKLQKQDAAIANTVMKRMMAKGVLVLPIHDSFITCHEIQNDLKSEMRRAYEEHVGNDIAIKADTSILDVVANEPGSLELDSLELVANLMDRPGFDGYRTRYDEFLKSRRSDWFKRFDVL